MLPLVEIDIDPVIVTIGPLQLRWYSLMIMAGVLVGTAIAARMAQRRGISADDVYGAALWIVVGGIVGARLAHVFDPYPQVLSVRQRRDYRVPSVSALMRAAEAARASSVPDDEDPGVVESVGEAVLELLQAGDGSLSSLDVPELEPLDGLLTVSEVAKPLDLEAYEDSDGTGPFAPAADDQLIGRLDEHPFLPDDDEDHSGHDHTGHQH